MDDELESRLNRIQLGLDNTYRAIGFAIVWGGLLLFVVIVLLIVLLWRFSHFPA